MNFGSFVIGVTGYPTDNMCTVQIQSLLQAMFAGVMSLSTRQTRCQNTSNYCSAQASLTKT